MNPDLLKNRLDSLKQRTGVKQTNRRPPAAPEGWEERAPFVYRKTLIEEVPSPLQLSGLFTPKCRDREKLCFYDIETTGLSGGAGTTVFLAGFGRYETEGFRIDQFFLSDLPGEKAFMEELARFGSPAWHFVSYNGKSFDYPLLCSKAALHGVELDWPLQADLLYPSRRLWRSLLPNCSLGTIESRVLEIKRLLDVPGSQIPDLYYHYLKSGRPLTLAGVFAHHSQDITTLALLLNYLEKTAAHPFTAEGIDKSGLAIFLLGKSPSMGRQLLENEMRDGNLRAGRFLGDHIKRTNGRPAAGPVWDFLWEYFRDPYAAVEQAKIKEHDEKNPAAALGIVEEALRLPFFRISRFKDDLVHRRERLSQKAI